MAWDDGGDGGMNFDDALSRSQDVQQNVAAGLYVPDGSGGYKYPNQDKGFGGWRQWIDDNAAQIAMAAVTMGAGAGIGGAAAAEGTAGAGALSGAATGLEAAEAGFASNAFAPDAIQKMIELQQSTGGGNLTWSDAARQAGYASPEAYLASQGFGGQVNMPGGGGTPGEGAPVSEGVFKPNPNFVPGQLNMGNVAAGTPSWIAKAGLSGFSGPSGMSGPGGMFGMAKSAFDIGSGIYGLSQQQKQRKLAEQAFETYKSKSDPYAGARNLMANPGSVSTMPGYQFGMDQGRQAIMRRGAADGGGGNEAIALARYTPEYAQNFYNNEVARQMQLGNGEAAVGNSGAQIGNNFMNNANTLASQSLGSIGYGVTRMGGLDTNAQYAQLLERIFRGG